MKICHIRMIGKFLLSTVAALGLAGCAGAPPKPVEMPRSDYSYVKEYISWLARKEMKKNNVTGLSIALVDDQKVVWAEGFGYADKANEIPATPSTVYRAGSISKLFTATAAMQLVEQGKLNIDKPLSTYLPEFSINSRFPDASPITPRTIMTHHSGLPSDLAKGMWTKNPEPFENNLDRLKYEYAAYPPDFVFSYSNVGVTVLGHALENVAGRDFAAHMDASILKPLGMSHSGFSLGPDRTVNGAKAYRKGREAEELPLRDVPAGGLNTTVLDLSRFMEMIFAGGRIGELQIVKPETLAEMLRPQNAHVPLDLNFRVGLGWMLSGLGGIDIRNAGPVAHHGGATLYHRSQLVLLPEQKLGVVVMANSADAGGVVNMLATEALKLALEAKTGIRQPVQEKPAYAAESLPLEALQAYEGRYATVAGLVNVSRRSDYLRGEVMDATLRLVPRADGLLGVQYRLLGLIPISLGDLDYIGLSRAVVAGRDILKAHFGAQEMLVGERVRPEPLGEKLTRFIGEYEIVNRGDDAVLFEKVRVRQEGDFLLVEYGLPLFAEGRMSMAIKPISETEALTCGLGRGMGETIRAVTVDGEELLQYSGYLLRKKPD